MYGTAAPVYLDRGWNQVFPLHAGTKFPPPGKDDEKNGVGPARPVTGNCPTFPESWIEEWIHGRPDDPRWPEHRAADNVGIRMPQFRLDGEGYEVIGLDVDQYGTKTGWDTFQQLIERLGPLPATYRSTSRDPLNPSGIRFYLVPAQRKWRGNPGPDIETIQRTHRFAAVWPSVHPDTKRVYTWYAEDLESGTSVPLDGPPDVADIPELPEAWQHHLLRGMAGPDREPVRRGGAVTDGESARQWLSENMPGYDSAPSSEMARASQPAALAKEASGGAHDMLISRVHWVIRLGAEGHHGLRGALVAIQRAFYSEVFGEFEPESARRDLVTGKAEVDKAIVGEVATLQQEIADGLAMVSPIGGYSPEDGKVDTSILLARLANRRKVPDAEEFSLNDLGRAEMVLEMWEGVLRPIEGFPGTWGWWNEGARRYDQLTSDQLVQTAWRPAVIAAYERASSNCHEMAAAAMENGDDDTAKELSKTAGEYYLAARLAGNKATISAGMSLAYSLSQDRMKLDDMDRDPLLLGVGNGLLDFTKVRENKELARADMLRTARPDDLVFSNTNVDYDEHASSPAWESFLKTFLPDPEYRRFVRKALGYALLRGNPERLIMFLYGDTTTGKSTILDAIAGALGDYARPISANAVFREKADGGPNPELIAAAGRRVVFCSEVGQHNRLHSDVLKRLAGGKDQISARALYSNTMVSKTPDFTALIASNPPGPVIQDGDKALWRRLLILPFDVQMLDSGVPEVDLAEDPESQRAVLAWLVEGLLDYLSEGLHRDGWPETCTARRQRFIGETSDFQTFLSESVIDTPGTMVFADQVYAQYRTWCENAGVRANEVLTRKAFYSRMTANGIARERKSVRPKDGGNPRYREIFFGVTLVT